MAKGFTNANVASAVRHHSKMDLSRTHITSLNFAQIVPLFHEELTLTDKVSVHSNLFSRMSPLVVPTYGRADLRTLTVFCPYYQVAKDFDAWSSGQKYFNGVATIQRTIDDKTIRDFFLPSVNRSCSVQVTPPSTPDSTLAWFDFKVDQNTTPSSTKYYKFTSIGKYYYKVFRALGYQLPSLLSMNDNLMTTTYSAMPLLAFFKVFNDLMSQSTKVNTSSLSKFLYNVKVNVTSTNASGTTYSAATGKIWSYGMREMFDSLFLMYANDYFTSAWAMPNSPVSGMPNDRQARISFTDTYNAGALATLNVDVSDNTIGAKANVVSSQATFTQRALDYLSAFDRFVRRNNYSGSRAVQNIYARFGIKTDDYKAHFPDMITSDSMPIQIGDIMSNSDTYDESTGSGMKVGEYTGKGIISGGNSFTYHSSENGMLFVLGWIQAKPIYADGVERQCLRTSFMDYYQPEFDALSGEVISVREVVTNNKENTGGSSTNHDGDVFGFTEKYNSYRFGHDQITGDFATMYGMDAWHFGRNLKDLKNEGKVVAQDSSMVKQLPEYSEFQRIFAVTDGVEDTFYLTCHFDVEAIRPMGSLSDALDLGEGSVNIDRNGNNVQ